MKPIDFVPRPHPENVKVSDIPAGKDLGAMLEMGEIDALISANNPKCILENSPKVARLFPDYVAVEREYYRRIGIFPIMHTVVIRKDRLAEYPDPDIFFLYLPGFTSAINSSLHSAAPRSPSALTAPAHSYAPPSPHSICIGTASAAPAASF